MAEKMSLDGSKPIGFNQGRKAATKDIIDAIDDFLKYDYPEQDDGFIRGMKKAREIVKDWGGR